MDEDQPGLYLRDLLAWLEQGVGLLPDSLRRNLTAVEATDHDVSEVLVRIHVGPVSPEHGSLHRPGTAACHPRGHCASVQPHKQVSGS